MKFSFTVEELYVFNKYAKSVSIKSNLKKIDAKLNERISEYKEMAAINSLIEKNVLQKKGDKYILSDIIRPYAKTLDYAKHGVCELTYVNDGIELEITKICTIKKKTIGLYYSDDLINLEFYNRSSLNDVLIDLLGIKHCRMSTELPPFVITLYNDKVEDFIKEYEVDKETAINKHHKKLGLPADRLSTLASIVVDYESDQWFLYSIRDIYIFFQFHYKDNTVIVKRNIWAAYDSSLSKVVFAHLSADKLIEWMFKYKW
ncbi:MAG: hypothetical protein LBC96_06125 [Lachnospiraceae bacterium]|jgi:hypothetical protein|nr:hypothetical protein [Lachnospiraceae bacterium]